MRVFQVAYVRATFFVAAFAVILLLPFKFGAGQEVSSEQTSGQSVRLSCADQTVTVDPTDGTNPKAVFLCAGNKLTWDADGHQFIAIFKKSPFVDGQKFFDEHHNQSAAAKNDVQVTVYTYFMIVDHEIVDDPQVVGGGGHSN
jgi:hypothetical protein